MTLNLTSKLVCFRVMLVCSLVCFAGCTHVEYRPVQLPLIAHPKLPTVDRSEVQCLRDDVYTRLADRERGYKTWGLSYEAEVKANNAKAAANGKP